MTQYQTLVNFLLKEAQCQKQKLQPHDLRTCLFDQSPAELEELVLMIQSLMSDLPQTVICSDKRWLLNFLGPYSNPRNIELFNRAAETYKQRCRKEIDMDKKQLSKCTLLDKLLSQGTEEFKEKFSAPNIVDINSLILVPYLVRAFNPTEKGSCFFYFFIEMKENKDGKLILNAVDSRDSTTSKQCLKHAKKIVCMLNVGVQSYDTQRNSRHANLLLIDLEAKEIELFEPHGAEGYQGVEENSIRIMQFVIQYLVNQKIVTGEQVNSFRLLSPKQLCPYGKKWEWQGDTDSCAFFRMLYSILRITCSKLDRGFILNAIQASKNENQVLHRFYLIIQELIHKIPPDVWKQATEIINASPSEPRVRAAQRLLQIGLPKLAVETMKNFGSLGSSKKMNDSKDKSPFSRGFGSGFGLSGMDSGMDEPSPRRAFIRSNSFGLSQMDESPLSTGSIESFDYP